MYWSLASVLVLAARARREEGDDWLRLVPLIILVVVWGLVWIGSWIKKANEQAKALAGQRQGIVARTVPRAAPVLRSIGGPPPPVARIPPPAPQVYSSRRAPAPPVIPAMAPLPTPRRAALAPTPAATGTHRAPIDRNAIRRLLHPHVLRKQYIVTELFDPPVGLRESSGEGDGR